MLIQISILKMLEEIFYKKIMLKPRIVGEEHYKIAQKVKETLQRYEKLLTDSKNSGSRNTLFS